VCLGIALGDAAATAGMQAVTQDAWGRNYGGGLNPPNEVAVAYRGSWWLKNTSGGTLAYGVRLITGAAGSFAAAGATPDARTIVGIVIEPGGIANNAEGRVRLTILPLPVALFSIRNRSLSRLPVTLRSLLSSVRSPRLSRTSRCPLSRRRRSAVSV
jgi:hypothetical protein